MGSLSAWRQIGQGQFHKWETPGDALEGAWQGSHEGPVWTARAVETVAGILTFPLHAALVQRLQHVRIGADVLIRYTGPQTSKQGVCSRGSKSSSPALTMVSTSPRCPATMSPAEA